MPLSYTQLHVHCHCFTITYMFTVIVLHLPTCSLPLSYTYMFSAIVLYSITCSLSLSYTHLHVHCHYLTLICSLPLSYTHLHVHCDCLKLTYMYYKQAQPQRTFNAGSPMMQQTPTRPPNANMRMNMAGHQYSGYLTIDVTWQLI